MGRLDAGYGLEYYRDEHGHKWPMHVLTLQLAEHATAQRGVIVILYDLRREIGYERLQGLFDREMRKSQTIMDTLRVGVVAVGRDGTMTTYNRAAGRLLGIDPLVTLGKPLELLPDKVADLLRSVMDGRQTQGQLMVSFGEKELLVEVASLPAQDGAVAVIGDVTLWNKMQRDAQRADRLALIGEMAAGTAHEIRNPLTALRGFLQLLRQRLQANPDCACEVEWIDLMLGEADRINRVVNEFLQLARTREETVSIAEPAEIVQALFPVIENECLLHDMIARLIIEPDLPAIEVDAERIKQVVLNLAQNGIQAMEKGGTLTIEVHYHRAEEEVAISITDQGCGIPEEDRKRIFDPFFTTKEAGTGLGLAICQRIVEDHHGRITVTSEVGVGSTFTVLLPAAQRRGDTVEALATGTCAEVAGGLPGH